MNTDRRPAGPWFREGRWHKRALADGTRLAIAEPNGWCRQWFVAISESDGACGASTHSDTRADSRALSERAAKAWATKWARRLPENER